MVRFQAVQWLPVDVSKVFAFFSCPANLTRIMPPEVHVLVVWAKLIPPAVAIPNLNPIDAAGAGSEFVFAFRPIPLLPMTMQWRARIEEYEPGRYFRDSQIFGPMRRWNHHHEFQPEFRNGLQGTLISDNVEFEVGYGWAGKLLERGLVLPMMRKSFEQRQGLVERALCS